MIAPCGVVGRTRGLSLDPNLPQPESLIAIALRNERRYHGVLWAAYNKQHIFTEAELQYISTLASHAALAVTNIRLYLTVEARVFLQAQKPLNQVLKQTQNSLKSIWQSLGQG